MESASAVRSLAALAQATRLSVYRLLVQQGPSGLAAGEIASQLDLAPATLSFHLKELAHAGLVRARQVGRFIFYAADFETMSSLIAFLTENCCAADGGTCETAVACSPKDASAITRKGAATQRRSRTEGVKR
jgi:DNA-binding transcriptional ArsR family regulator